MTSFARFFLKVHVQYPKIGCWMLMPYDLKLIIWKSKGKINVTGSFVILWLYELYKSKI